MGVAGRVHLMTVLAIAGVGVAIVLFSILGLRLHPLIALLLGSLFLLGATPESVRLENQLREHTHRVAGLSQGLVGLESKIAQGSYLLRQGEQALADAPLVQLSHATPRQLSDAQERGGLEPAGLVWYVPDPTTRPLAIDQQLTSADALSLSNGNRFRELGSQLSAGFANTFRRLGIPVTMAAIIGVCLLESGAAARLVAAIVALLGPRGTAPALTLSGFMLGVPVYFDNVFYLLLPLAKAVGRQRPEFYLTAVMAIIVGATMAHSLVPPTPGPLFVATELGVSIGAMMIGGLVVGVLSASVGFAYGSLCHRWIQLSPEQTQLSAPSAAVEPARRVPLVIAALPIALPLLILAGAEIVQFFVAARESSGELARNGLGGGLVKLNELLATASDPSLLFIATAVLAIFMLRYSTDRRTVARSVARGLSDAGVIVLLTCAGGAFGAALQQLGLAEALSAEYAGFTTPWGMLLTAFFLTTIIRAAQGSATVAMITSVAIIAPVIDTIDLPFDPIYLALAIGCGSKPLPWMNDSGFWQVATMTGMTSSQTLKTFSVALTLMGITGFAVTLLGAWLLPLV